MIQSDTSIHMSFGFLNNPHPPSYLNSLIVDVSAFFYPALTVQPLDHKRGFKMTRSCFEKCILKKNYKHIFYILLERISIKIKFIHTSRPKYVQLHVFDDKFPPKVY